MGPGSLTNRSSYQVKEPNGSKNFDFSIRLLCLRLLEKRQNAKFESKGTRVGVRDSFED